MSRAASSLALALLAGLMIVGHIAGRQRLDLRTACVLVAVAIAGLASQIALAAYAAAPDDGFLAWRPLVLLATETWSGKIVLVRLVLALAAVPALVFATPLARSFAGLAVGLNLVLLPLSGHSASIDPWWASAALHSLHTLSLAAWAGAVAVMAIEVHRAGNPSEHRRLIERFSPLALALVLAGVVTGLAATCLQLGRPAALFGTAYGQLLLVKAVALLGVALASAAWLRWRYLGNRAEASPRRILLIEAAMCCGMIAIASAMSQSIPGRHADIDWPLPFRFDLRLLAPGSGTATVLWGHLGIAGAMLALSLAGAAMRRWTLAGASAFAAVLIGTLGLTGLAVTAYPTSFSASPSAYSVDRLAKAEGLFAKHCALCHGATGHGDGPAMRAMGILAADLTAPHTGDHTEGDMYWWITHGRQDTVMEGVESETSEEDRWDLVNYVRLLANSARSAEVGYDIAPLQPFLPSIDFSYTGAAGALQTIRDAEGVQPVLLVLAREPWSIERLQDFEAQQSQLRDADLLVVFVCGPETRDSVSPDGHPAGIEVITAQDDPIIKIWSYYRRTPYIPDPDGRDTNIGHQEYLIDRYGYVRAKWRSDEGIMPSVGTIIDIAKTLAAEPRLLPPPELHLH